MAPSLIGTSPGSTFVLSRQTLERQEELVRATTQRLNEQLATRGSLNMICEEVAARVAPAWKNSFNFLSTNTPYQKNTDQQVDSNGMMALSRFMAICDSLLSPRNQTWHTLGPEDDYLVKDREARLWFYNTTRKLFKFRYSPVSNFSANNQGVYHSLGAFGTGVLFIDQFYDMMGRRKALRYKNIPFGDIYLEQNHQGLYDGFTRIMRLTAREAFKQWPGMQDRWPEMIKQALEKNSDRKFIFLHRVCPRDDYNPGYLDYRGKPYASYYICMDTRTFVDEGGYLSFPIAATRYYQGPNEQDGRGVAMDVLPSLKTLDAEKRVFLKQGHRAGDPIILLADDGIVNGNMRPGAQNRGALTKDGKRLMDILPTGEIQVTSEMMMEEKSLINDAFLVALFQIMTEKNGMTATEVIERVNEKGILIAPTLGRQEGEYFGPMIDRELVVMAEMGVLDKLPPALLEAGGRYSVKYNSPLSKASRAQEASGFLRTVQEVTEIAGVTQDNSLFDVFNFDRAIPDIAEIQGAPEPWMASPDEIAAKRAARKQQSDVAQQIQAAPAAAAMIKAQAAAAKAGGAAPGGSV